MKRRMLPALFLLLIGCGGGGGGAGNPILGPSNSNMAGNWTFTVTASTSCSQLPVAYRSHGVRVSITQNEFGPIVGNFIGVNDPAGIGTSLSGSVAGNAVNLAFSVFDLVSNNVELGAQGIGDGTIGGSRISGSFVGYFYLVDPRFSPARSIVPDCKAADHQFVFVRQ